MDLFEAGIDALDAQGIDPVGMRVRDIISAAPVEAHRVALREAVDL